MSKRKIVALILFIFVSLFMFSFASPRGIGIKKNNNVPEKEIFTVVFKNYDGTILDEQTIEKGNSASYQGETPKRPNSKICNYEFTGWSDSIQNVTSNIDVVAQYNCEKRSYVVRFMDDDKVTLLATDKVNAGGTAIYSGKTPTKTNHVFNGWNDTLSNILSNKTVYATYYADYNHNDIDDTKEDHYNITFKAGENGSLEGTTTYTNILTGLTFEQANIIIPTPVPNKNYKFKEWTPKINKTVSASVEYTAEFYPDFNNNNIDDREEEHYTIEFLAGEHGILEGTTTYENILTGLTFEQANIVIPKVKANENYKANGWDKEINTTVTEDATYTAQYFADFNNNDIDDETERVTVIFYAGEHGIIGNSKEYMVEGLLPGYDNYPDAPNIDVYFGYGFKAWHPNYNANTMIPLENASLEFTATYFEDKNHNGIDDETEDHYTVKFNAGLHGTLEGQTTYENILTGLTFSEAGIVIPTINANENYKANGWDKEINTKVTENATYTAQYFADFNNNDIDDETEKVTVKFYKGEYGNFKEGSTTEYPNLLPGYDNYPTAPEVVANDNYGFKAWNPNYNANTMIPLENASLEFTATYFEDKNHNGIDDETEDHYTVKFNAGLHGTLEGQTTYENILTGLTFSEAGIVIPTINANENYKANGWDKEINTKVTENATYTAQYFADFNNNDIDDETEKVTVKFYKGEYGNFKEGSTTEYPNLLPGYDNYPTAPEVVANDNYGFKAWNPNYNANTMIPLENASLEFTATYFEDKNHNGIDDETEDHYTVKFNAGLHGTLEGQTTYENILTGLTFSEAGIVIPTINANENYKANGWDKEINTIVTENATYTAQYFADFNNNDIDDESEKITITFVPGEHGNFAENSQTSYVLLPGYDNYPEAPEVIANNKYEHTGWTPTLPLGQIAITVNSDITYTATYTKTTADIAVNVTSNITRNGTAVAGSIVEYGDKINYTITIKNNDTVDGSVNLKNIINGNLDTTDLPEEYRALLTNEGYTVNVTANNTVTIKFSLTVKSNVNETVRTDLAYSVDGNETNTIEGTEYNTEKTITIIEKTETVNGTNIVIVIDRSASMDGNRIKKAKEATNSFIDKVFTKNSNTHGSTVTVVTFGTTAKWVDGWLFSGYEHTPYANQIGTTATDYDTAQKLKNAVNNIKNKTTNPGGSGTPYFIGLEKAYGILYDETTGLSTNGNQNAVIFLSDGAPDDTDNVTLRENNINKLKDKNTIMYTIGFGVTKDSDAHNVLKTVAYGNADNTYLAKDDGTNDLVNVFSAISSKIADKSKSKQTTKGVAEIGQTVVADATHQIIVKVNGTETYKFNSLEEALASGVITSNTTGYKVNATKFQAGDKIEVSYYASIS